MSVNLHLSVLNESQIQHYKLVSTLKIYTETYRSSSSDFQTNRFSLQVILYMRDLKRYHKLASSLLLNPYFGTINFSNLIVFPPTTWSWLKLWAKTMHKPEKKWNNISLRTNLPFLPRHFSYCFSFFFQAFNLIPLLLC